MAKPVNDDCPVDFLLLWHTALKRWAANAAWYGLNGHTFLGRLAALYSLADVRERLQVKATKSIEEELGHPVSLASGLYSTAKLMPSRRQRRLVFEDGLAHLNKTIRERDRLTANLAQMLGSFHLALGETNRAVEAFEEALRRRHTENAPEGQIGESMSELGYAYLFQMRFFKGREFLEEGTRLMRARKDTAPGFYVRALRKLAVGYAITGKFWMASETLAAATTLAREKELFDQLND